MHSVRYKVGDAGIFNLANLSIQYGGAGAVTLIDTIVFKNSADAENNVVLWVHELKHVQQFRNWGTRDFTIRYLRSWNGVEGEAYAAQDQYIQWRNSQSAASPPLAPRYASPQVAFPRPVGATACTTSYGACPMGIAIAAGSPCYCPSMYGPVWGIAR
ncbi:eCIS core domain-containing protein [Pseudorhodoferax soli]|uniref:eCIS core domain-containing protein n=1 Tax=Pseudorhodoferax soli TaxID=545864 RepID=UPI003CCC4FD1